MDLTDKKVAVFLAKGYEDAELTEPVAALRKAGVRVTLIGLNPEDKKGVTGKHGTTTAADATIVEVDAADFDALVIPGGRSPGLLRQDKRILDFTREIDQEGKPLAAICHGPQVLASADLLRGRKATSFFTVRNEVRKAGGLYANKPVVIDNNLITSRMPRDIPAFIDAIFTALEAQGEGGASGPGNREILEEQPSRGAVHGTR